MRAKHLCGLFCLIKAPFVTSVIFTVMVGCDDKNVGRSVPLIDLRAGSGGDPGGDDVGDGGVTPEERCPHVFSLREVDRSLEEVRLAGDFEMPPWSGEIELSKHTTERGTQWVVALELPPGTYAYKLIVDGQWMEDPNATVTTPDGVGGQNSALNHSCPSEPECTLDEGCAEALTPYCVSGVCRETTTPLRCARCDESERCDLFTGLCELPPPPQCDAERPCGAPLVCVDGACRPECQADEDCEGEARCVELSCVTPSCAPLEGLDELAPVGQSEGCDLLEERCDGVSCQPRPCAEQLFILDPDTLPELLSDPSLLVSAHVAGNFNGWAPSVDEGGWPLVPLPDGRWYTRRPLENGAYEYKFVLTFADRVEWVADPAAEGFVNDGVNGQNATREVSCMGGEGGGSCGPLDEFRWEDAVMYFVMIDRFYDSDASVDPVPGATGGDARSGPSGQYEGGDLSGVREKLPYLQSLGVNAIWLSAPYENRDEAGAAIDPAADPHVYSAYHGYWPSPADVDYSDPMNPSPTPLVESKIGTAEDLESLVDAAHEGEVKVLFDYVMNHVDINSGLYQAHPDWFARRDGSIALCGPENLWNDPYWGTRCAFTEYLPPFDFDQEEARRWSVNDALWWAERFGIDGYRLDAIKHVSLQWLLELREALSERITDPAGGRFYLVGETFSYNDRELLRSFVDPQTLLDGQFDFPYKARLCEALFRPNGRLDQFASWTQDNERFYGAGALMTTWIGNHDIPRPIHFASGQIDNCEQGSFPGNGWSNQFTQPQDAAPYQRLGLAFAVMLTGPGIPLIYYGDEVGLAGGGDPDNRRMMPWGADELNEHQIELRTLVQKLTQARAAYPVLSRGRRVTLSSDQDTWVYRMVGCGSGTPEVTVLINRADEPRAVTVPSGQYTDQLTGDRVMGGALMARARSALILTPEQP